MSGPWEEYQSKENKQPSGPWDEYKGSTGPSEDLTKYKDHPVSTFAANAVNALTFGLPEYLNKTFTPQTYAEGQKYQEANPMAANLGTGVGEVAGYAVPAGYGAVKGAQLGTRAAGALAERFGPKVAEMLGPEMAKYAGLANLYGKSQGAITGATMGAQAGAALPGVVQGEPGKAVAASELVNQYANSIPAINHLGGLTGQIVPAAAGMAASVSQGARNAVANMATGYTPSPQEARNLLDSGDERTINTYGGRQRLQAIANPNAINSGYAQELNRLGR